VKCAHCLCTCSFPSFYHSLDCLLTTLDLRIQLYRMFYSINQVFDEERTYYEEFRLLFLLDHQYSCHSFILVVFFASIYIRLSYHSISLFIYYLVWPFICIITVIVNHYSRFIYHVHLTSGLARIHGVFSLRISVVNSRRIFTPAYFATRGVTVSDSAIAFASHIRGLYYIPVFWEVERDSLRPEQFSLGTVKKLHARST